MSRHLDPDPLPGGAEPGRDQIFLQGAVVIQKDVVAACRAAPGRRSAVTARSVR
ncbi:MAG: hypothetical protein U0401_22890 [Anaerolineae bacterium]